MQTASLGPGCGHACGALGRVGGIAALVAALALIVASVQLVMTPASHADPSANAVTANAQSGVRLDRGGRGGRASGGEWETTGTGTVTPLDGATSYGSVSQPLAKPIVGMAATPDGGGYWLVGADGGIFSFGDAVFHGGTGGTHLNAPIVGMAATPDGGGYWLVGSDGGIFSFGDAVFHGGTGGYAPERTHRRDGGHAGREGLLAGRCRRRDLLLR